MATPGEAVVVRLPERFDMQEAGCETRPELLVWCVEPSAGIEPATLSLPFELLHTCNRERRGQKDSSIRG